MNVERTYEVLEELQRAAGYEDLNVLDVSNNPELCPVTLASIVKKFPLLVLDISSCRLHPADLCLLLSDGVAKNRTLARVNMNYNPLNASAAMALRLAVCRNNVVTLVLDGCIRHEKDLDVVFSIVSAKPSVVDMSLCDIKLARPVKHIYAARIGRNIAASFLSHLRLDASAFDTEGTGLVTRGLAIAPDLRNLLLGPTRAYAYHFNYDALAEARCLVNLTLGHCESLDGALRLVESSTTLQHVNLSIRVADDAAYIRMAEAVRNSVSIKTFCIQYKRATCSDSVRCAFLFSILESATIRRVALGARRSWAPRCITLDLIPFLKISLLRCKTLRSLEILDVALAPSARYKLGIFLQYTKLDTFRLAGLTCNSREEIRTMGDILMRQKQPPAVSAPAVSFVRSEPRPCDTDSQ